MITKAHLINPSFYTVLNYYTPSPNTELYKLAQKHGFTFPENNEKLIDAFKNGMRIPWLKRRDENWVLYLKYFYYRFSDPNYYKKPNKDRLSSRFLNKLFYNVIKFRVLINSFDFPLEAMIYLWLLKIVTREDYYKKMFDKGSIIKKVVIE